MEFSPLGLVVSVAVLGPNLLLIWFAPSPSMPRVNVPRPLAWLERAGQVLCLAVPAFAPAGERSDSWAVPTLLALAGYYALWGRYLRSGRRASALYRSWWVLPVPMAVLPVVVFAGAAAWLANPWIGFAAGVLAAGHVPVSVLTARAVLGGGGS